MVPNLVKTGRVGIKICGIRTLDDAIRCIDLGADAIGLNFWNKSKRFVSRETVESWVDKLDPNVERIGVFVNESYDVITSLVKDGIIHAIQLHGEEDDSFCRKFSDEYKIIRATGIKDDDSVKRAKNILIETVLLDAYCGNDFGGLGHTFEWEYAKMFKLENPERPLILAGGLCPSNVSRAINDVKPSAVDVASGVENESGYKDFELLEKFINSVRNF